MRFSTYNKSKLRMRGGTIRFTVKSSEVKVSIEGMFFPKEEEYLPVITLPKKPKKPHRFTVKNIEDDKFINAYISKSGVLSVEFKSTKPIKLVFNTTYFI